MNPTEYSQRTVEKITLQIVSAQQDMTKISLFNKLREDLEIVDGEPAAGEDNVEALLGSDVEIIEEDSVRGASLIAAISDEELFRDTITLTTEAEVITEGTVMTFRYEESEATGMKGSVTQITFDQALPGTVSILRDGTVKTAIVLDEKRRHICTYNTPVMPFEMCTYARKITNTLSKDSGTLELDYIIEIKGAAAQHTVMTISVL